MRCFTRALVRQAGLDSASDRPLVILNNACGRGSVSAEIYEVLNRQTTMRMELICGDIDGNLVHLVRQIIKDKD